MSTNIFNNTKSVGVSLAGRVDLANQLLMSGVITSAQQYCAAIAPTTAFQAWTIEQELNDFTDGIREQLENMAWVRIPLPPALEDNAHSYLDLEDEIITWLLKCGQGSFHKSTPTSWDSHVVFWFKNRNDAMYVKLTWGGE